MQNVTIGDIVLKCLLRHVVYPSGKPARGGQAEDTTSPSLPKVRNRILWLHLWRLGSKASSTFVTSGLRLALRYFFNAS